MGHHDALFKHAFRQVEHARDVLATALPRSIAARIDFATLRLLPDSFVDEALRDRHADLLFSAYIGDRPGLLYLLWEHKSEPDPLTPFQVLRYEVKIWDAHIASLLPDDRRKLRKLPVILPVVLHHGPEGWTVARSFAHLLDGDDDLLALLGNHVVRFELIVDDLHAQSDDDLYQRTAGAFARLVLWFLRNARDAGWLSGEIGRWKQLLREVSWGPDGLRALVALVEYAARVNPARSPDVLAQLPDDMAPEVKEKVMNWLELQVDRGRDEGEKKALRGALLKLLRLRFGALPAPLVERIEAATTAELEVWIERFATAGSIDDVLGPA